MNTKKKFGYFSINFIILAACIYGLYYIITKITKLSTEDGKKNAGKIFGLVIAILLVFGISFISFSDIILIIKSK